MKTVLDDWRIWLVASLTLGLAPFVPEPHIVGKIRWIAGGADGMQPMDWFDAILHGTPFLLLFRALIIKLRPKAEAPNQLKSVLVLLLLPTLFLSSCNKDTLTNQPEEMRHSDHENWAYSGVSAPDHWGELSPDYIKCAEGLHQSPIDIQTHQTSTLHGELEFEYRSTPVDLVNDGHTIQARPSDDNILRALGKEWHLLQVHFHDPAEHHIDGIIYPMEVHLVHRDKDDQLSVVAIMVKEGPQNEYLQALWDSIPQASGTHVHVDTELDIPRIIPLAGATYHYQGSLTTPPCSEGVEWFILSEPMKLSKAQIRKFKALYPGNSRPIQEHPVDVEELN